MNNVLTFKKKAEHTGTTLTKAEARVWAILASEMTDANLLADLYKVSAQTVRNVKMLKTKRAETVRVKMIAAGVIPHLWEPAPRFSEQQIADIRSSSMTSKKLAGIYGCSPSTIRMIKTGKSYV